MVGRTAKYTVKDWVDIARRMLIEEGVAGLKVDRLANRLGVTRGGFYHHFKDRDEFFDKVIQHWEQTCRFLPDDGPPNKPAMALQWLQQLIERLIVADGYDYQFDLVVREWARSDKRAQWAVERADRERLDSLKRCYEVMGYEGEQAIHRARVFYYHQIGYYAIGVIESVAERRTNAAIYLHILSGEKADLLTGSPSRAGLPAVGSSEAIARRA